MQRSSVGFFGCLWKQPTTPQLWTQSKYAIRHMASYDSSRPTRKASGKIATSGNTATSSTAATSNSGSDFSSSSSNASGSFRVDLTGQRQIKRETNMWSDPQRLDTKWLLPCDPRRYKPDFRQTEPQSLRKQFMRSPDERTRDAMGRDWEMNIRVANNKRRQIFIEKFKRDQETQSNRNMQEQQAQQQQQQQQQQPHSMAQLPRAIKRD